MNLWNRLRRWLTAMAQGEARMRIRRPRMTLRQRWERFIGVGGLGQRMAERQFARRTDPLRHVPRGQRRAVLEARAWQASAKDRALNARDARSPETRALQARVSRTDSPAARARVSSAARTGRSR